MPKWHFVGWHILFFGMLPIPGVFAFFILSMGGWRERERDFDLLFSAFTVDPLYVPCPGMEPTALEYGVDTLTN